MSDRKIEQPRQGAEMIKALEKGEQPPGVAADLKVDLGPQGGIVRVNQPRPDDWKAPEPAQ
jgi:hypothetical protein